MPFSSVPARFPYTSELDLKQVDDVVALILKALTQAKLHLPNFRQYLFRYAEELEEVGIPLQRLYVHEHRSTGVGDVGGVDGAAGQVPHQPRVDGAKEQPVLLEGARNLGNVVQQPAELQGREVGGDREAAQVLQVVGGVGVAREAIQNRLHGGLRPRVEPDDGVVQRLPRQLVPNDRRLPLVGHRDASNSRVFSITEINQPD